MAKSFAHTASGGVLLWKGDPKCQNGHSAMLDWLKDTVHNFLTKKEADERLLSGGGKANILRGNLGESIAFCVSHWHDCEGHWPNAVNAYRPLSPSSAIDIDILWVYFAPKAEDDYAIIQEVKTTSGLDLSYGNTLLADYEKLYGTDPGLTLRSRLKPLKKQIFYQSLNGNGKELSERLTALAGKSPQTSPKIRLRPSLVHELNGTNPQPKMTWIRNSLIGRGWTADLIEAWSIGLSDLDDRLHRLATGKN
jgi:hypothetical protein